VGGEQQASRPTTAGESSTSRLDDALPEQGVTAAVDPSVAPPVSEVDPPPDVDFPPSATDPVVVVESRPPTADPSAPRPVFDLSIAFLILPENYIVKDVVPSDSVRCCSSPPGHRCARVRVGL
jgi:hypothetical protein